MSDYPVYDDAAREKIRRRLLDYKLAFKIGAPRLATLIGAAHPHTVEVDYRRVARFLAKQTRPDEKFIGWCQRFLDSAPAPTTDTRRELAAALQDFSGPVSPGSPDYTGVYEATSVAHPGDPTVKARVTIVANETFWTVESQDSSQSSGVYEGVLISTPGYGLAMLSHRLTGELRLYTVDLNQTDFGGTDLLIVRADRLLNKPVRLEKVDG